MPQRGGRTIGKSASDGRERPDRYGWRMDRACNIYKMGVALRSDNLCKILFVALEKDRINLAYRDA